MVDISCLKYERKTKLAKNISIKFCQWFIKRSLFVMTEINEDRNKKCIYYISIYTCKRKDWTIFILTRRGGDLSPRFLSPTYRTLILRAGMGYPHGTNRSEILPSQLLLQLTTLYVTSLLWGSGRDLETYSRLFSNYNLLLFWQRVLLYVDTHIIINKKKKRKERKRKFLPIK